MTKQNDRGDWLIPNNSKEEVDGLAYVCVWRGRPMHDD